MNEYPKIEVKRKIGDEPFHKNGKPIDNNLLSFWQWSASDLVGNTMRGILAEYIVTSALGVAKGSRIEWESYDIKTVEGIKIEVKSGSYIQSWEQKKLSNIQFSIRPTKGWDPKNNSYTTDIKRQSDLYVFCILNHKEKSTVDPLNLEQWLFYVLNTNILNSELGNQKTITLSSLKNLNPIESTYSDLYSVIKKSFKKLCNIKE